MILLEQNYRSTKRILQAANEVIKNNSNRKPKNLWTENDEGIKLSYYSGDNEFGEGQFVAGKIYELHSSAGGSFPISRFYTGQTPSRASLRKPF